MSGHFLSEERELRQRVKMLRDALQQLYSASMDALDDVKVWGLKDTLANAQINAQEVLERLK